MNDFIYWLLIILNINVGYLVVVLRQIFYVLCVIGIYW